MPDMTKLMNLFRPVKIVQLILIGWEQLLEMWGRWLEQELQLEGIQVSFIEYVTVSHWKLSFSTRSISRHEQISTFCCHGNEKKHSGSFTKTTTK